MNRLIRTLTGALLAAGCCAQVHADNTSAAKQVAENSPWTQKACAYMKEHEIEMRFMCFTAPADQKPFCQEALTLSDKFKKSSCTGH